MFYLKIKTTYPKTSLIFPVLEQEQISLTDVELSEGVYNQMKDKGLKIDLKEVDGKKFVKGGRLHMYPPGMNLFRKCL